MAKFGRYIIAFCLFFCFSISTVAYASTPQITSTTEVVYFDDGTYLEIITTVSTVSTISRGTIKDASKEYLYKTRPGEKLFSYTLFGRFEYNGSTSEATNVDSSHTIYNSDWNFGSSRESYSGNTVYGSATFGGPYIKTIGGSISCDKNGHIS